MNFKRLLAFLLLLPAISLAQSIPNGGSITTGQIWTAAQWAAAWQSKADTAAIGVTIPTYPQIAAEATVGVCNTGCTLTYPPGDDRRYGATGNGTTDDTTALQNAASVGIPLTVAAGTYKTSATIAFINSVYGFDAQKTLISSTNLSAPTATVQGANLDVKGITFTHSSTPTAGTGADGLQVLTGSYQIDVSHNVANFNDNGIKVAAGSSALWIEKNNASNNASAGFLLQNPNYIVRGDVSTTNGGFGYQMTINGAQGAGLQLSDDLSYNNIGGGYSFVGSGSSGGATSLDDVLAPNDISSFDEGNGWFFDTHGINFQLSNNYTEYCGYVPAGTIVSNGAVGYSFTANNGAVVMGNDIAYHCTSNGLFNGGADVTITGGKLYDNGLGSGGGYGIQGTNAGFTNVTGTTFAANATSAVSTIAGFAAFYGPIGLPPVSATSGFGTGPSVGGVLTSAFRIFVGASGTPSITTTVTFPYAAPTGWNCVAYDTTHPTFLAVPAAGGSTTTALQTWSTAPALGDALNYQCGPV